MKHKVRKWSERIHLISYLCQILISLIEKWWLERRNTQDDRFLLHDDLYIKGSQFCRMTLSSHLRRKVWCHVREKRTHEQRKWESVVYYSATQRPQNFYQWPSGLHKWKEVRLMTNIESQALVGSGWHRLACKLHRRMDKGSAPFWQLRKTSWILLFSTNWTHL